ncbi:MAG TPA: hypothetical protein VKB26_10770, partial [Candidatus Acidoferrales bacterium]|nr:hypothetical protein [Candidatus Acidoferrales bacterium]
AVCEPLDILFGLGVRAQLAVLRPKNFNHSVANCGIKSDFFCRGANSCLIWRMAIELLHAFKIIIE